MNTRIVASLPLPKIFCSAARSPPLQAPSLPPKISSLLKISSSPKISSLALYHRRRLHSPDLNPNLPPLHLSPLQLPSPPYEPHQAFLLALILSKLGFQELAMACHFKYGPSQPLKGAHISGSLLYTWSGPLTLFAPSADSLHSCPSYSPLSLLREHLIPGLFSLPYLSKLTFGTTIDITSPDHCLTITSSSATTGASNLPGSAIVRLMLCYAIVAFPCNLQSPDPAITVSAPLLLCMDPPSIPSLPCLPHLPLTP